MRADDQQFTAGWGTANIQYALDVLRHRDEVILAAVWALMSKAEIHRRSGLSRTTIDIIISRSPRSRLGR